MRNSNNNFKRKNRNSGNFNKRKNRNGRKGRKASELNPDQLINKAIPITEEQTKAGKLFADLPINGELKQRILKKGFVNMTEIQEKTIEPLVNGRDVMGIANTGTGKTGAFLIPVLHNLLSNEHPFQTLILVPTRELALQVEEEFKSLTKGLKLYCTCLIGGTSINRDIQNLRRMSHIVVGTPGRVADLIKRKALKLRPFSILILDEFDRMLDMGFVDEVTRITNEMHDREQTMLFSATENKKQKAIIDQFLDDPIKVRVSSGQTSAKNIDQDVIRINNGEDKFDILLNLVKKQDFEKVILFAETKRNVSKLASRLRKSGINTDEIHGDKTQAYRKKALSKFKSGRIQILVATDVAARGIDVDDVSHVINYQLPQNMESYVHRIGRTGRAGKAGKAITLVD